MVRAESDGESNSYFRLRPLANIERFDEVVLFSLPEAKP